jgi:hypothetical protein
MTPKTEERYIESCSKLAAVTTGIQLQSYEPIHLLMDATIHLLLLEGLHNLMAVVVEGTLGDGAVEWTSQSATKPISRP